MARILIADDDRLVRQMLRDLLEADGHEVMECSDGSSALEAVSRVPPDLVFLDLIMPGLPGSHVAASLKGDERTHFIPLVILTGECDEQTRVALLDAGADEFLSKPFSPAQLAAKVRSLLRAKELHDRLVGSFQGVEILEHLNMELIRGLSDTRGGDEEFLIRALEHWNAWEDGRGAPTHLWVCVDRPGELDALALAHIPDAPTRARTVRMGRKRFIDLLEPYRQVAYTYWSDGVQPSVLEAIWPDAPVGTRLAGVLEGDMWVLASGFPRGVTVYDSRWLASLARQCQVFRTFLGQLRATEEAFQYTMEALARAAEAHDDATGAHLQRVNAFSAFLAQALGCDRTFIRAVGATAMMHDVGKIHIHPEILRKPGRLSEPEMEMMKKHTLFGARILGESPRLSLARDIALCHHERWDGAGYPAGATGEEIPLCARIVALSDIYDALRSPRFYKPALPHEEAVRILRRGDERGGPGMFDPRCLEAFLDVANHMDELYGRFHEMTPPPSA